MILKKILGLVLFLGALLPAHAQTYQLDVKGSPNGILEVESVYENKTYKKTLNPSEKMASVLADRDSKVTIKAVPKQNHRVEGWTGAGNANSSAETVEFSLNGNKTVECSMVPVTN